MHRCFCLVLLNRSFELSQLIGFGLSDVELMPTQPRQVRRPEGSLRTHSQRQGEWRHIRAARRVLEDCRVGAIT